MGGKNLNSKLGTIQKDSLHLASGDKVMNILLL